MGPTLSQAIQLLEAYKYLILFPLAFIEGPAITIIAGFAASLGYLNIIVALATVIIADLAADSMYYVIGRFGREQFIDKWGRFVAINAKKAESLEKTFSQHIGKSLWIGKTTLVIGIAFLVAAGLIHYPYKKFLTINFVATTLKSLVLILIGFYFGQTYNLLGHDLNYLTTGTTIIVVALIAVYLVRKRLGQ